MAILRPLMLMFVLLAGCGDDEPAAGAFGADCASDADCDEPNVCYEFNNGSQCTVPCPANPSDCPEPSSGCNSMMPAFCKTK